MPCKAPKDKAVAIQRNAKDQDRLAELTRGAALSGDKEALARLTAGDSRLEGIAAEAGTEKSLRDAAKRGSRNAAMVLADMEKSKATQWMAQAKLQLDYARLEIDKLKLEIERMRIESAERVAMYRVETDANAKAASNDTAMQTSMHRDATSVQVAEIRAGTELDKQERQHEHETGMVLLDELTAPEPTTTIDIIPGA